MGEPADHSSVKAGSAAGGGRGLSPRPQYPEKRLNHLNPEKRQQVVTPLRRVAQLASETQSDCRKNLVHTETQADPLFSRSP